MEVGGNMRRVGEVDGKEGRDGRETMRVRERSGEARGGGG